MEARPPKTKRSFKELILWKVAARKTILGIKDPSAVLKGISELVNKKSPDYDESFEKTILQWCPLLLINVARLRRQAALATIAHRRGRHDIGNCFSAAGSPEGERLVENLLGYLKTVDPAMQEFDLEEFQKISAIDENHSLIRLHSELHLLLVADLNHRRCFKFGSVGDYARQESLSRARHAYGTVQYGPDAVTRLLEVYCSPVSSHWDKFYSSEIEKFSGWWMRPIVLFLASSHWDSVKSSHLEYLNSFTAAELKNFNSIESLIVSQDKRMSNLGLYLDYIANPDKVTHVGDHYINPYVGVGWGNSRNNHTRFFQEEIFKIAFEKFSHLYQKSEFADTCFQILTNPKLYAQLQEERRRKFNTEAEKFEPKKY